MEKQQKWLRVESELQGAVELVLRRLPELMKEDVEARSFEARCLGQLGCHDVFTTWRLRLQ